jgi:prepilin-type N-terminal cleavage/methylation domain-containing protein
MILPVAEDRIMNRFFRRSSNTRSGFTLLEMAIVLVLAGFVAVVVYSRFSNINANAVADGETLKSQIRYIRTRALADVYTWQLAVAGQTCTVTRNSNPAATYTVTFNTTGVAAGTITFNNRGEPSGTLSFAVTNYPASPVVVTAESGLVP